MPTFDYSFEIHAPVSAVGAFHHDTRALRQLSPPPILVQLHDIEPLGEGSVSKFTMWFGPFPVRWTAVHSNVSENGFTDRLENGLLRRWEHSHRFTALSEDVTLITEHIDYEHRSGIRGLISRVLFARPGLWFLFTYRKLATRRLVENQRKT